jgi:ATP adenylyltransferase
VKNLWAPWRMKYILDKDKGGQEGCIFCVSDSEAAPNKDRLILKVGPLSMVMMNRYPYNNGHLLVAPRRHVPDLAGLDREEMADLLSHVRLSVEVLKTSSHPDGFNVGLNLGRMAGAGLEEHLHFHIVPRWSGDTNFMTVLDDVRVVPEHIEAAFDRLVKHFGG